MNPIERELKGFIRYWTFPILRPRKFHVFGLGMPKTGTHSLAAIFNRYRCVHEPDSQAFMELAMARRDGGLSDARARDRVRRLDRKLWLEFNSSYLNYFILDLLLEEYPDAKFVLTIRDCYSWLDSIFNQVLGVQHSELERHFHRWYAASVSPGSHCDGDRALDENGLQPLDTYLRAWTTINERVLSMVPSERMIVVRTRNIGNRLEAMAEFLGVAQETLNAHGSHEFKAPKRFRFLSQLDPTYLADCVEEHCSRLMARFFPEVSALADVRGYRPQDVEGSV